MVALLNMCKVFIALIFIALNVEVSAVFICPKKCSCQESQLKVVCVSKNITFNDLMDLWNEIDNNTVILDLSNNQLQNFNFTVLKKLTDLILRKNHLTSFPKRLGIFPALKNLDISCNKISKIQKEDFINLNHLEKLRLDGNLMISIPSGGIFQHLSKLEQLYLGSNSIELIGEGAFEGIENLTLIDLNNNKIKDIPVYFFDDFSNNKLVVNLPHNMIKIIPNGLFTKLQKFEMLDLANNSITTISKNTFLNVNLTTLNLGENKITKLSKSSFENFIFNDLAILENPLNCDCQMADLLMYLRKNNKQSSLVYGKCVTPNYTHNEDLSVLWKTDENDWREKFCTKCDLNNTCLNDGICIATSKNQSECKCVGDFKGRNCEISPVCWGDQCSNHTRTIIIVVFVVLFVLLVVIIVAVYLVKYRRKNKRDPTNNELMNEYNVVSTNET